MAVSRDNTLEILIRTKAELEGAQAAAESLERQVGRAKALGQEYGKLEDQLARAKNAIAQAKAAGDKLGESHEEAGRKAEFLGLKHGQLHKLVHQLGEAFPVAGAAARLFMNPVVFAASAAIAVFAKAKEKLAELNAEMDKAAEAAAKPVVGLDTFRGALNATVDDIHRLRTEFDHWAKLLGERSGEISQDLAAETEAFKEQVQAAQELLQAKKNLQLQRIEEDQHLTPEQKAAERFKVETSAEEEGRNLSLSAGRVEVSKTAEALTSVSQQKLDLADRVDAAEAAVEAARSGLHDKQFEAQQAAALAERDRAKADRDKVLEKSGNAQAAVQSVIAQWGGPGKDPSQWIGRSVQEKADKAKAEFDSADRRFNQADAAARRTDDEAARRKARLEEATQALTDLKDKAVKRKAEFDQLSISLDRLQRHQETAEKSAAAKAPIERAERISKLLGSGDVSGVTGALTGAETIAEKARSGKIVTDQERQALVQLGSQIAGKPLSFDQSRDYFAGLTHRPGEAESAKAAIDQRVVYALEKLEGVLQTIATRDRNETANRAAHPGTPIKPDEYARFRAGFKTATDEVGDAVRQVWLDMTTEIRALAKKIQQDTAKKPAGSD